MRENERAIQRRPGMGVVDTAVTVFGCADMFLFQRLGKKERFNKGSQSNGSSDDIGKSREKGGELMRERLRQARKEKRMTQQALADKLGISLRHYQRIESGTSYGTFEIWDVLEDYFNIHQRILRDFSATAYDLKANQ